MKQIKFLTICASVISLILITSCKKDEETDAAPTASFVSSIVIGNSLTVSFQNESTGEGNTYAWDFGDDNTSTEVNPEHTYSTAGTYTVKLTATNSTGSNTFERDVTVTAANPLLEFLAGSNQKTWILQREGIALGVGPAAEDVQWFAFGGASAPLGDRPCVLDDEYTFSTDGTFKNDTKGTFFMDAEANGGWNDALGRETCIDESTSGAFTTSSGTDFSAFANGGTYTFNADNSTKTLSVAGRGAYIGLPAKTNAGDLGPNGTIPPVSNFSVIRTGEGSTADTLVLGLAFPNSAGSDGVNAFWTYYLVSYNNSIDIPNIPDSKSNASFTSSVSDSNPLIVSFTNTSSNATSYEWNFGDGSGTSTDESPTYTYSSFGTYDVRLIAIGNDNRDSTTMEVVLADPNAIVLSALIGDESKTWKLAPRAGALRVGDQGAGSANWWSSSEADVTARACLFDDEFELTKSGGLNFDPKSQVWVEDYWNAGVADGCNDISTITGASTAWASKQSHSFTFDLAQATITVNGSGAFFGFPKGGDGAEVNLASGALPTTLTYKILTYVDGSDEDELVVSINIGGNAHWTYTLVSKD